MNIITPSKRTLKAKGGQQGKQDRDVQGAEGMKTRETAHASFEEKQDERRGIALDEAIAWLAELARLPRLPDRVVLLCGYGWCDSDEKKVDA